MTTKTKAKARKATKPQDDIRAPRHHDAAVAGDAALQGDLIFVVLDKLPASAKAAKSNQLAEGETMGSRHVVVDGTVYTCDPREVADAIKRLTGRTVDAEFIGPVFVGGTVTHPQHEHHVYPAECVVGVVFQRNVDAERRIQRARD